MSKAGHTVILDEDPTSEEISISTMIDTVLLTFYISTEEGENHDYFATSRKGETLREESFETLAEAEAFALKTF